MLSITATGAWRRAHPGATIGLLELSGMDNHHPSLRLDQQKRTTEVLLRTHYLNFTRPDFLALPAMAAYERYYKRFEKTYHVQLQVESIVLKGKSLPNVSPLVDANFIAEVETLVLTAGHDVDRLAGPVFMDVSSADDHLTQMNGLSRLIRAGDMVMRDDGGICCSIIYGQDNRSPITAGTTHVLFVAYAPAGVSAELVDTQLRKIEENIRLFSGTVVVEQHRLLSANGGD